MSDTIELNGGALAALMPMHMVLDGDGFVRSTGPTLAKIFTDEDMAGRALHDLFDVRHPADGLEKLLAGYVPRQKVRLYPRNGARCALKGEAIALGGGQGVFINLSLGISIVDAVRQFGLTQRDFASTDLAVELLYLVEAKNAVMGEAMRLNSRLSAARSKAQEQALTDMLTGLRNRRGLNLALEALIAKRAVFSVLHIDLDFFKTVNDTLGHAAGDEVLRRVGDILTDETRGHDIAARAGGDEFVVVLEGESDPKVLKILSDRIIARLEEPIPFDGTLCKISGSIGATTSRSYRYPAIDQLLHDADVALYAAKDAGKGCFRMAEIGQEDDTRQTA